MNRHHSFVPAALLILLAPAAASAHTGIGGGWGFVDGLVHPFVGLDHLLAMVAVGFWAAHLGGRARWQVPAAFVAAMAVAASLAMTGTTMPFIEFGIALSVLGLGLVIALRRRFALPIVFGLVGVFAVFHGFAHGAEIPVTDTPLAYAAGFLAATAFLHAVGVGLGTVARGPWAFRLSGSAVAAAGLVFMVAS
jgi:urease accessory protein